MDYKNKDSKVSEFPKPTYVNGFRIFTHVQNEINDNIEISSNIVDRNLQKPKDKNKLKTFIIFVICVIILFILMYKLIANYINSVKLKSTPSGSFTWKVSG
ncbi:hypothetical protein H311_04540 [Anncaliia algerae PRA109]|nr:hypothetical protein H311_04540 [Anncaliia algerae PRA109]